MQSKGTETVIPEIEIESDAEFDGVVVAWHPEPFGRGNGFVRLVDERGSANRKSVGLYLRESNIITTGVETLRVGSRVRCQIGDPEPGYTTALAIRVCIYK
jgi:hypothetical protein